MKTRVNLKYFVNDCSSPDKKIDKMLNVQDIQYRYLCEIFLAMRIRILQKVSYIECYFREIRKRL